MGFNLILATILLLVGLAGAAAIFYWHKILDWAQSSLFLWIRENLPYKLPIPITINNQQIDTFEALVREAFVILDDVAVTIRQGVRLAWEKLREFLLGQIIKFEKNQDNQWIKIVTSYMIKTLDSGEEVPVKHETTEIMNPDELPPEIREAFIRRTEIKDLNVTTLREQEVYEMQE